VALSRATIHRILTREGAVVPDPKKRHNAGHNDGGCLTAAVMFGVAGIRVLAAGEVGGELHLLVETVERVGGCRCCGVVAVAHRRREHLLTL
jgi:hypothetical protein